MTQIPEVKARRHKELDRQTDRETVKQTDRDAD